MERVGKLFPWFGLRQQMMLLFFLCTLVPASVVGYISYTAALQSLRENISAKDRYQVDIVSTQFRDYFAAVVEDLHFLQAFSPLRSLFYWHEIGEPYRTQAWQETVQDTLISLFLTTQRYSRIQLLDAKNQELLHLRYTPQSGITFAPLQAQTSDPFFSIIQNLSKQEIAISGLSADEDSPDSNSPVLRIAIALFDSKTQLKYGNIVFTVRVQALLHLLAKENAQNLAFYFLLIDQQGQYIYHGQRSLLWQDKGQLSSLRDDMPGVFEKVRAGKPGVIKELNIQALNAIWSVATIPLPGHHSKEENFWYLIKHTNLENSIFQRIIGFNQFVVTIFSLTILIVLLFAIWFTRRLLRPLIQVKQQLSQLAKGHLPETSITYQLGGEIAEIAQATEQLKAGFQDLIVQANTIASGDYTRSVRLLSDQDQLGFALLGMTRMLREARARNQNQSWLKTGQNALNEVMSGDKSVDELAQEVISYLPLYLNAQVGILYLAETQNEQTVLRQMASYAFTPLNDNATLWPLGQGLVGQAALERRMFLVDDVSAESLRIRSGVGEAAALSVIVIPFAFEETLKGVLELGALQPFSALHQDFLRQIMPALGIAIHTAQARTQLQQLLARTQLQTEQLQQQAAELEASQEELRRAADELEIRAQNLDEQRLAIVEKNIELTTMRQESEQRARELELAYRYKSEFLANMSHELRTPLNSLLILAQLLRENRQNNLQPRQIEYVETIYSAAHQLLSLINEILDLSKVEAGKLELQPEDITLSALEEAIHRKFDHLAQEKELEFHLKIAPNLPSTLHTDANRLRQILNNLLTNAFKFTEQGEVKLEISYPNEAESAGLSNETWLAMRVHDTGIGIAAEQFETIFEAFQQADGSTSRKYGGTGLGLSISRQLAELLGGKLQVTSQVGRGSTFTLLIPTTLSAVTHAYQAPLSAQPPTAAQTADLSEQRPSATWEDDRTILHPDSKALLIIEDDLNFARLLMELGREKGFQCLCATNGKEGLALAEQHQPTAIILDLGLPKLDGWGVMEHLKQNKATRHIPVHFISACEGHNQARQMGAIGFLLKPVTGEQLSKAFHTIEQFIHAPLKKVLLFCENSERQDSLREIMAYDQVEVMVAQQAEGAYRLLAESGIDCIVVDYTPYHDSEVGHLLRFLNQNVAYQHIPVLLYTERPLTDAQQAAIEADSLELTVKTVYSPQRLLDEATLFLHQVEAHLPSQQHGVLRLMHDKDAIFHDKRILLVDDDMRNVFALATLLEQKDMEVEIAKNGREALKKLHGERPIDLVLMDIMMPEMDGYQAMREIRAQSHFAKLPILALTANAMQNDKARCIDAGASDYLAKPIDTDKLLSMMRVWLYK